MQKKITIINSNQSWNPKKRYKINEVVFYNGVEFQNTTGGNSEPGVGLDWISIDAMAVASTETSGTVKLTSFDANPTVYPKSEMDFLLNEKLNIADVPSNLNLYPTNVASDISGYSKMVVSLDDVDYNDTAVDISTAAITGADQLVASLASSAGILIGNPGIINVTTIGNVRRLSGTGTAEFYFKVFKRTSAGVETLIATSNSTMPISNSVYGEFQATAILNNGTFTATDRVVIKYYANRIVGNSDPIYQFQFGGVAPVRTILPVPFSVIPDNGVGGSGTINTIPKFTAIGTIGNSNISDNGTIVSVATDMNINGNTVGRGGGNRQSNLAIGSSALISNTTGSNNLGIGASALGVNTTGGGNLGIGASALGVNTTGISNLAIGSSALISNTTGSNNLGIGASALGVNTTGSNNLGIGASAGTDAVANITTQSNQIVIGNNSATNAYIKIGWTVTSDARDKTNFAPVPYGLEFVNSLQPIKYQFREFRDTDVAVGDVKYGFKAQDILALEGDNPVIIDAKDPDNLKYTEGNMIPVLVNAIKELKAEIDLLKQ